MSAAKRPAAARAGVEAAAASSRAVELPNTTSGAATSVGVEMETALAACGGGVGKPGHCPPVVTAIGPPGCGKSAHLNSVWLNLEEPLLPSRLGAAHVTTSVVVVLTDKAWPFVRATPLYAAYFTNTVVVTLDACDKATVAKMRALLTQTMSDVVPPGLICVRVPDAALPHGAVVVDIPGMRTIPPNSPTWFAVRMATAVVIVGTRIAAVDELVEPLAQLLPEKPGSTAWFVPAVCLLCHKGDGDNVEQGRTIAQMNVRAAAVRATETLVHEAQPTKDAIATALCASTHLGFVEDKVGAHATFLGAARSVATTAAAVYAVRWAALVAWSARLSDTKTAQTAAARALARVEDEQPARDRMFQRVADAFVQSPDHYSKTRAAVELEMWRSIMAAIIDAVTEHAPANMGDVMRGACMQAASFDRQFLRNFIAMACRTSHLKSDGERTLPLDLFRTLCADMASRTVSGVASRVTSSGTAEQRAALRTAADRCMAEIMHGFRSAVAAIARRYYAANPLDVGVWRASETALEGVAAQMAKNTHALDGALLSAMPHKPSQQRLDPPGRVRFVTEAATDTAPVVVVYTKPGVRLEMSMPSLGTSVCVTSAYAAMGAALALDAAIRDVIAALDANIEALIAEAEPDLPRVFGHLMFVTPGVDGGSLELYLKAAKEARAAKTSLGPNLTALVLDVTRIANIAVDIADGAAVVLPAALRDLLGAPTQIDELRARLREKGVRVLAFDPARATMSGW